MATILFFVTEDWYFCSHRLPLALAAHQEGHDVVVLTRVRDHGSVIRGHGLTLIPLEMSRRGKNVLTELALLIRIFGAYKLVRPDLVHHVAIKPIVYGSLAAWFARVPHVVNALNGLGYVFSSQDIKARLLRPLLRAAFRIVLSRGNSHVIVQNPDDHALLVAERLTTPAKTHLILGSGVDTRIYSASSEQSSRTLIVLPARILWDKGVGEFVAAAKLLRRSGVIARFALVGEPDTENPAAVPIETIKAWVQEDIVEWWGERHDMPVVYAQSHIVCLPSYREGLPKSLLEAAACSRPIVTTDAPGCREIVREGQNGLLVPVRDVKALADALYRLIADAELRTTMGARGREIVVSEFGIEKVISQTLSLYREVLT